MKKLMLCALLLSAGLFTRGQDKKTLSGAGGWVVDAMHSSVKFTVVHLGITEVEGRFKMYTGIVESPSADFSKASISLGIDAMSVNTDNERRDLHLRSEDFFDVGKYPRIRFTGTSFVKKVGNQYTLEGDLTIKDVTKKVTLAVTFGGITTDQNNSTRAGFKALGKISRKAFNLSWNNLNAAGNAIVGDDVTLLINIELSKTTQ